MNLIYEIIFENNKYNIYYYTNNELETIEFYAYDLSNPQTIIRYGYKQKIN
jgi:hypothetical protein